jgi:hypothetical protein
VSLSEGTTRGSKRDNQIGRAVDKEGAEVIDKLVFGVQLLGTRRDAEKSW